MDEISINHRLVRQLIERKRKKLPQLEAILHELALRVYSRLEYIKLQPQRIIDCGSGAGYDAKILRQKFPQAQVVQLDCALGLLRQQQLGQSLWQRIYRRSPALICADAACLPLANATFDLCYANLLLPYLSDIQVFIKEMRRVLTLGGAFCISGLGVDSFKELRALGLSSYRFVDMHDVGDMLVAAGFTNPVVDTEYITLEYADLATLLAEVKLVGCGSANDAKLIKHLSKAKWQEIHALRHMPSKLTLEIFVAHGWKDQLHLDLPAGQQPLVFKPR